MDPILFISDLIAKLGYVGVALAMFIEALFPPIPSEIVLPFAGFAAAQGKLSFIGVLVSATVGSIVGATVLYLFGKLVTESHLKKLVKKWGKPFGIRHADIVKANEWFNKHGSKAVFFGRMIPGVRTFISLPAGINRMNFGSFIFWSTVGTAFWTIILCTLGYFLGSRYSEVSEYLGLVSKIVAVLGGAALIYLIAVRVKAGSAMEPDEDEQE